jgi:hypothetical protein
MEQVAREAYKIKIQIKTLEAKYSEMMDTIKADCNGQSKRWGNYRVVITSRPGPVDYASIPLLKDVALELYRKPSVDVYKLECLGE